MKRRVTAAVAAAFRTCDMLMSMTTIPLTLCAILVLASTTTLAESAQSVNGLADGGLRAVLQLTDRDGVAWLRKAAEQRNADAQTNLGWMYEKGRGVPQDDKEAVVWYRKAAEQGNAGAQNGLGVMYMRGLGVTQDDKEALVWLRKAAEQENTDAKNKLRVMSENGQIHEGTSGGSRIAP